jgi:hypothetical protein
MRRLLWMGVGAVVAGVAARRVRQTAQKLTPEGVADQVAAAGSRTVGALRDAVVEFRTASAAREHELVTALLTEPEGGTVAERRARAGATRRDRTDGAGRAEGRSFDYDDDDEDDFF